MTGEIRAVSAATMHRLATIRARAALEELRCLSGCLNTTQELSGAIAVDGGTWVFVPEPTKK
jgi:hypothetical protein